MTDAEYKELKYAAIAMGEKPVRLSDDGRDLLMWGIYEPWNPRKSDRDAMQVLVRLKLIVGVYGKYAVVSGTCETPGIRPQKEELICTYDECGGDENAATRLAITRAAAEIGKQMGGGDV